MAKEPRKSKQLSRRQETISETDPFHDWLVWLRLHFPNLSTNLYLVIARTIAMGESDTSLVLQMVDPLLMFIAQKVLDVFGIILSFKLDVIHQDVDVSFLSLAKVMGHKTRNTIRFISCQKL
jgi:hypothetical protein